MKQNFTGFSKRNPFLSKKDNEYVYWFSGFLKDSNRVNREAK